MTTNAPVGPAICTREPPSAETRKPATMAVHRPRSGDTPLAMANAIARGSATMPTMTPARPSRRNWSRSYVLSDVTILGMRAEGRFGMREAGWMKRKRLVVQLRRHLDHRFAKARVFEEFTRRLVLYRGREHDARSAVRLEEV